MLNIYIKVLTTVVNEWNADCVIHLLVKKTLRERPSVSYFIHFCISCTTNLD